ncbi:unnamed protein product [Amoebophrya sp. A120]|nr:unnamed protein product [Amoebophrya sp. A120]|eukprot:GSA120T00000837001.1
MSVEEAGGTVAEDPGTAASAGASTVSVDNSEEHENFYAAANQDVNFSEPNHEGEQAGDDAAAPPHQQGTTDVVVNKKHNEITADQHINASAAKAEIEELRQRAVDRRGGRMEEEEIYKRGHNDHIEAEGEQKYADDHARTRGPKAEAEAEQHAEHEIQQEQHESERHRDRVHDSDTSEIDESEDVLRRPVHDAMRSSTRTLVDEVHDVVDMVTSVFQMDDLVENLRFNDAQNTGTSSSNARTASGGIMMGGTNNRSPPQSQTAEENGGTPAASSASRSRAGTTTGVVEAEKQPSSTAEAIVASLTSENVRSTVKQTVSGVVLGLTSVIDELLPPEDEEEARAGTTAKNINGNRNLHSRAVLGGGQDQDQLYPFVTEDVGSDETVLSQVPSEDDSDDLDFDDHLADIATNSKNSRKDPIQSKSNSTGASGTEFFSDATWEEVVKTTVEDAELRTTVSGLPVQSKKTTNSGDQDHHVFDVEETRHDAVSRNPDADAAYQVLANAARGEQGKNKDHEHDDDGIVDVEVLHSVSDEHEELQDHEQGKQGLASTNPRLEEKDFPGTNNAVPLLSNSPILEDIPLPEQWESSPEKSSPEKSSPSKQAPLSAKQFGSSLQGAAKISTAVVGPTSSSSRSRSNSPNSSPAFARAPHFMGPQLALDSRGGAQPTSFVFPSTLPVFSQDINAGTMSPLDLTPANNPVESSPDRPPLLEEMSDSPLLGPEEPEFFPEMDSGADGSFQAQDQETTEHEDPAPSPMAGMLAGGVEEAEAVKKRVESSTPMVHLSAAAGALEQDAVISASAAHVVSSSVEDENKLSVLAATSTTPGVCSVTPPGTSKLKRMPARGPEGENKPPPSSAALPPLLQPKLSSADDPELSQQEQPPTTSTTIAASSPLPLVVVSESDGLSKETIVDDYFRGKSRSPPLTEPPAIEINMPPQEDVVVGGLVEAQAVPAQAQLGDDAQNNDEEDNNLAAGDVIAEEKTKVTSQPVRPQGTPDEGREGELGEQQLPGSGEGPSVSPEVLDGMVNNNTHGAAGSSKDIVDEDDEGDGNISLAKLSFRRPNTSVAFGDGGESSASEAAKNADGQERNHADGEDEENTNTVDSAAPVIPATRQNASITFGAPSSSDLDEAREDAPVGGGAEVAESGAAIVFPQRANASVSFGAPSSNSEAEEVGIAPVLLEKDAGEDQPDEHEPPATATAGADVSSSVEEGDAVKMPVAEQPNAGSTSSEVAAANSTTATTQRATASVNFGAPSASENEGDGRAETTGQINAGVELPTADIIRATNEDAGSPNPQQVLDQGKDVAESVRASIREAVLQADREVEEENIMLNSTAAGGGGAVETSETIQQEMGVAPEAPVIAEPDAAGDLSLLELSNLDEEPDEDGEQPQAAMVVIDQETTATAQRYDVNSTQENENADQVQDQQDEDITTQPSLLPAGLAELAAGESDAMAVPVPDSPLVSPEEDSFLEDRGGGESLGNKNLPTSSSTTLAGAVDPIFTPDAERADTAAAPTTTETMEWSENGRNNIEEEQNQPAVVDDGNIPLAELSKATQDVEIYTSDAGEAGDDSTADFVADAKNESTAELQADVKNDGTTSTAAPPGAVEPQAEQVVGVDPNARKNWAEIVRRKFKFEKPGTRTSRLKKPDFKSVVDQRLASASPRERLSAKRDRMRKTRGTANVGEGGEDPAAAAASRGGIAVGENETKLDHLQQDEDKGEQAVSATGDDDETKNDVVLLQSDAAELVNALEQEVDNVKPEIKSTRFSKRTSQVQFDLDTAEHLVGHDVEDVKNNMDLREETQHQDLNVDKTPTLADVEKENINNENQYNLDAVLSPATSSPLHEKWGSSSEGSPDAVRAVTATDEDYFQAEGETSEIGNADSRAAGTSTSSGEPAQQRPKDSGNVVSDEANDQKNAEEQNPPDHPLTLGEEAPLPETEQQLMGEQEQMQEPQETLQQGQFEYSTEGEHFCEQLLASSSMHSTSKTSSAASSFVTAAAGSKTISNATERVKDTVGQEVEEPHVLQQHQPPTLSGSGTYLYYRDADQSPERRFMFFGGTRNVDHMGNSTLPPNYCPTPSESSCSFSGRVSGNNGGSAAGGSQNVNAAGDELHAAVASSRQGQLNAQSKISTHSNTSSSSSSSAGLHNLENPPRERALSNQSRAEFFMISTPPARGTSEELVDEVEDFAEEGGTRSAGSSTGGTTSKKIKHRTKVFGRNSTGATPNNITAPGREEELLVHHQEEDRSWEDFYGVSPKKGCSASNADPRCTTTGRSPAGVLGGQQLHPCTGGAATMVDAATSPDHEYREDVGAGSSSSASTSFSAGGVLRWTTKGGAGGESQGTNAARSSRRIPSAAIPAPTKEMDVQVDMDELGQLSQSLLESSFLSTSTARRRRIDLGVNVKLDIDPRLDMDLHSFHL